MKVGYKMELCELLCTLSINQINKITFENKDVTKLLEYMINNNVSYSTIEDIENDTYIKQNYVDVFNAEVYTQDFEVTQNNKINLILE